MIFVRLSLITFWVLSWFLGGYWVVKSAFRLQPDEETFVGLAAGIIFQVVLSSILGQFLPFYLTTWLASAFIGIGGFLLAWRMGHLSIVKPTKTWIFFVVIFIVAFGMARGLAIFDDYAHLPTISTIAAGYFPPRFVYDKDISYSYHYFLILFSAQIMRILNWQPWNAFDITRSISFSIAIILGAIWGKRVIGRGIGMIIGSIPIAFAGGARWLLLLIPSHYLNQIGRSVTMLGSGVASGHSLAEALFNPWVIEGGPLINYPFAFVNGILHPGILMLNGANGLMSYVIIFVLLLISQRWKQPILASLVTTLILAGSYLINESDMIFWLAAIVLVTGVTFIQNRKMFLPLRLRYWWGILAGSIFFAMFQGGTWTDIIKQMLTFSAPQFSTETFASSTIKFDISLTPAFVSGHLGILDLTKLPTFLVALAEVGPLIFAFPLLLIWGYKAWRANRWYETILIAYALVGFSMLFVRYSGVLGVRNTSRLYVFLPITLLLIGPILYYWQKNRNYWIKTAVFLLSAIAILGGVVIFATQLSAIGKPVTTYYLNGLDVKMLKAHWNQLPREAVIFDPIPSRAPTVFGRFTKAGKTWYSFYDAWKEMYENPDPFVLHSQGFTHVYFDSNYWEKLDINIKDKWMTTSCVSSIDYLVDKRGDFRWLVGIGECNKN